MKVTGESRSDEELRGYVSQKRSGPVKKGNVSGKTMATNFRFTVDGSVVTGRQARLLWTRVRQAGQRRHLGSRAAPSQWPATSV